MTSLVLNELKLDYLTCTSWDTEFVLDEYTVHKSRVLNYNGYCHSDNKIFEGVGLQRGKEHRLCRLSSYRANELWELCVGMRASRLDLALDVKVSGLFAEELHCWSLIAQRRATFISTHENRKRKGFTLYVGSRKSERFLRIYDKSVESGLQEPDIIRFELELKGSIAAHVFRMVSEYGLSSPMQHIFRDEVSRLMEGFSLEEISWFAGDRTSMVLLSEARDHSYYLLNQVLPMLMKDQRNGYKEEVSLIIKKCLLNFMQEDYVYTKNEIIEALAQRDVKEQERDTIIELYEEMVKRNGQL